MQIPSWWRSRNIISWLLWPFSLLFGIIVFVRRQAYRMDIFRVYRPKLSVIVVGNINVGGTGKTPLVIALARQLQQLGMRPAIISRGYKSKAKQFPFVVTADTPVVLAGDEPLMMARHTHCMVMIDPCRVRAVKALEATGEYDIIISDDGLQHYALARDIEIVVVDNKQQFGNDFLLPAGMLREPVSRIENADIVVCNYEMHEDHKIQHQLLAILEKNNRYFKMHLKPTSVKSLTTDETVTLAAFKYKRVYAVAGIGNPERFFNMLREHQIDVTARAFSDHHTYIVSDFAFRHDNAVPLLMTEKDAVKCKNIAYNAWSVEVEAEIPDTLIQSIKELI